MEGLELICFQIIMNSGNARSYFVESINDARNYNFEEAQKKIDEGNKAFNNCHEFHAKLIQKEASEENIEFKLLLLHAEDLQMSAEMFGILAAQNLELCKKIQRLESNFSKSKV